jgi:hypothetical protein
MARLKFRRETLHCNAIPALLSLIPAETTNRLVGRLKPECHVLAPTLASVIGFPTEAKLIQ